MKLTNKKLLSLLALIMPCIVLFVPQASAKSKHGIVFPFFSALEKKKSKNPPLTSRGPIATHEEQLHHYFKNCLFNTNDTTHSFTWYVDRLTTIIKNNIEAFKQNLQKHDKDAYVAEILATFEKLKHSKNALNIGMTLSKYIEALPYKTQELLNNTSLADLLKNLKFRLSIRTTPTESQPQHDALPSETWLESAALYAAQMYDSLRSVKQRLLPNSTT